MKRARFGLLAIVASIAAGCSSQPKDGSTQADQQQGGFRDQVSYELTKPMPVNPQGGGQQVAAAQPTAAPPTRIASGGWVPPPGDYLTFSGDVLLKPTSDGNCWVMDPSSEMRQKWSRTTSCPPGPLTFVVPKACWNPADQTVSPGIQTTYLTGAPMSTPMSMKVVDNFTPTAEELALMQAAGIDTSCHTCPVVQQWITLHRYPPK